MGLGALTRPELIFPDLPATDRPGVLRALADRVARQGLVDERGGAVPEALGARAARLDRHRPGGRHPALQAERSPPEPGGGRPGAGGGGVRGGRRPAGEGLFWSSRPAGRRPSICRCWPPSRAGSRRTGMPAGSSVCTMRRGSTISCATRKADGERKYPEMQPMEPGSGAVPVAELLGEELSYLRLRVLSGESHLDNLVTHPRVQKPGLAFAGYYAYIKPGRVQIIGESETEYLKTLDDEERHERLDRITSLPVPVFVITKGLPPLPGFLSLCQNREVPRPLLARPVVDRHQGDQLLPGGPPGPLDLAARRAAGDLRPRRAADRRERGGEERVGPRPHHPRPQPGGGRQGAGQALSRTASWSATARGRCATTWSCGGSGSSTSRTSSASPRCASGRPSTW